MKHFHFFLTVLFAVKFASCEICKDDMFPVYSGGKRDEYVNCLVYDSNTEQIVVGGNSTSSDYAGLGSGPFLYAVDLQGNW